MCPLGGECEISEIVYKATITNVSDTKVYFGLTSRKFIERYRLHKSSMKLRDSKHHTTLSKEVWRLRDLGYSPSVTFTIHKRAKAAQAAATRCDLCITEKFSIITCTEPGLLNSNDELFSKCKHKAKWKISKVIWFDLNIPTVYINDVTYEKLHATSTFTITEIYSARIEDEDNLFLISIF